MLADGRDTAVTSDPKKEAPAGPSEVDLLTDIRDELRKGTTAV
jgi:hypothetical protein